MCCVLKAVPESSGQNVLRSTTCRNVPSGVMEARRIVVASDSVPFPAISSHVYFYLFALSCKGISYRAVVRDLPGWRNKQQQTRYAVIFLALVYVKY